MTQKRIRVEGVISEESPERIPSEAEAYRPLYLAWLAGLFLLACVISGLSGQIIIFLYTIGGYIINYINLTFYR